MSIISLLTRQGGLFAQWYSGPEPESFDRRHGLVSQFLILRDPKAEKAEQLVRLSSYARRYQFQEGWGLGSMSVYVQAIAPHVLAQLLDSPGSLLTTDKGEIDLDKWWESSKGVNAPLASLGEVLDGGPAAYRRLCREDVLHILLEHYDAVGPREGLTVEQILASPLKRRFYDEVIANNIIQTLNAELLVLGTPRGAQRIYSWWVNPEKAGEIRQEVSAFKARAAAHTSASMHGGAARQYDAFLCHASEDKAGIVVPFAGAMTEQGLKPWLDAGEVGWGDNLVAKINHGLTKSKCVVVFISPPFLGKKWPETELNAALSLEINGCAVVLPLLCGITHEQLRQAYPLVASKLCKELPVSAEGAQPSDLAPLVSELKAIVQKV